jgi:hypothetical protein
MSVLIEPEEIFFDDYPEFQPHYSPVTMLQLGVFKGGYFNHEPAAIQGWANLRSTINPESEFWKLLNEKLPQVSDYAQKLCNTKPNKEVNFFKVDAGKDQAYWEEKGWMHPDDPRGWFEWYIKFFYGRRHEDDERQIKRWKDFITRHWGMLNSLSNKYLEKHIEAFSLYIPDAIELATKASPTTCQNLLQWSWDYRIKPKTKK